VALNVVLVVNRGVCCADDAFFAGVAKNLAWGFGYSSSFGSGGPDFSLKRFDATITTGPPLIFPVSAAIGILGNRFWVPGAVQVTLWTVLLVAAWRALGPVATRCRAAIAGGVFLIVAYAVLPYHLEHWYAMLGEVPAALAILLGVAIWAVHPGSRRRSFIAATLCSLAVLTKALALVYAATFLAAAFAVGLAGGEREPKHLWRLLTPLLLGFLLPILAFEVCKATALGLEGYLAHLRAFIQLVFGYGTSRAASSPAEITTRLITFYTRFGVSLPGLLIVTIIGGSLAWRTGSRAFKRLYLVLLGGVALHACYWLALSLGMPRYIVIGVILLGALVAIPYLALEGAAPTLLYSGVLVLGLLGTVGRLQGPILGLGGAWFAPAALRSNQESVVRFLDARADRRPFVGQTWASVADVEYLSKRVRDFKGYEALAPAELSRGVLVVINSRFHEARDEQFASFVARCGRPVFVAPPYAVHECGGPDTTRRP
jgi:hypothetical protein